MTQRREYNAEIHGNVFEWIREECERQRYWQGRRDAPMAAPRPLVAARSLRDRNNSGYTVPAFQPQEPRPNAPGKHVFEISKARKL